MTDIAAQTTEFARTRFWVHPWLILVGGITAIHWVNPQFDNWLFYNLLMVILIISEYLPARLDKYTVLPMITSKRPGYAYWGLTTAVIVVAFILFSQPRHSDISNFLIVWILGPFAFIQGWSGPRYAPKDQDHLRRSIIYWGCWIVAIMLFELTATFMGNLTGRYDDFPPATNYLDVWLDGPIGKYVFIVGWLALGVMLFKLRPRESKTNQDEVTE